MSHDVPEDRPAPPVRRNGYIRRWMPAIIAVVTLVALTLAVYASNARDGEIASPVQPVDAMTKMIDPAEIVRVEARDLAENLPISGVVKPGRQAAVSAQVSGLADAVHVLPGQRVEAGDPLLSIDRRDFELALMGEEATLASLRAEMQTARSNLHRATKLVDRGTVAKASLEDAQMAVDRLKANIDVAETLVEVARLDLERTNLRAPFAGTIVSRDIEPGQLVPTGTPLFEIIDLSAVTVEAMVPLNDTPSLREGQAVQLWLPQDPSRHFEGRVTRINARAEADSRAAIVYLGVDNADGALRGGMFLAGRITLRAQSKIIALPRSAVDADGQSARVTAIRNGRLVDVPVSLGADWQSGKLVEITEGIVIGDRILARAMAGLRQGDSVQIAGN